MERTFKQELEDFNKTDLYLYKVVTAQEVKFALQRYTGPVEENEFEIICNFIYDWFTSTEADISDICECFFTGLCDGKFVIKDVINNYDKVEKIMYSYF